MFWTLKPKHIVRVCWESLAEIPVLEVFNAHLWHSFNSSPREMCVLDLEKAFNCVPWSVLWRVLWEYGVFGPLQWAIRSSYNRCKSLVRIASNKSDSFP